ncbi:MAG TPA: diguanylate cyclase [Ideonella sp.]|nr:diguanylate cyclase [Ideonella sp.]
MPPATARPTIPYPTPPMTDRSAATPAQLAKATLLRLAQSHQEPTPENYARAWAEETGAAAAAGTQPSSRARRVYEQMALRLVDDVGQRADLLQQLLLGQWDDAQRLLDRGANAAAAQSKAWAQLIDRLARALERGGRQWTAARKKDSLHRVLDSSGSDMQRMQHRLKQLVASWETDKEEPADTPEAVEDVAAVPIPDAPTLPAAPAPAEAAAAGPVPAPMAAPPADTALAASAWPDVLAPLSHTLCAALPPDSERAIALADELAVLADRLHGEGATPATAAAIAAWCERARLLLAHRHHLLAQVHQLSRELAGGLAELSEDDSWVRGQMDSLRDQLAEPLSARALQSAQQLLAHTRERQRTLRGERDNARLTLKDLIHRMLHELGELDQQTGSFSDGMQRYAHTIEQAESLESLAGVVREMVDDSRSVHALVSSTRARLQGGHSRAVALETRVRELEGELRRLSDEVATDALTQIANRRGLVQAFEIEQAQLARGDGAAGGLAIGLLDIDNFKRLNDSLGHGAGDQALVALAGRVRDSLRPGDTVARFGGEEFVVLLPGTPADEAQKVLTRLQRLLTASLFMHEDKEVFVTFSAGVTAYRPGEALEAALERADEALYEAKRTGKNRTCIG